MNSHMISELPNRIKLYISNGWDKKYLHHPEKETPKNYSIDQSTSSFVQSMLDHPPPSGYSNFLDNVPHIEDSDIYQYFLVQCDNTKSTAVKHRDQGWNFYQSGKVKGVEFNTEADETMLFIRANVIASYDKGNISGKSKKKYDVHIITDKMAGNILGGRCVCKAGLGGYCKHVAGVLFLIMDLKRKGESFVPEDGPKTSKLQSFHHPKVKGKTCVKFGDLEWTAFSYSGCAERNMTCKKPSKSYVSYHSCPMGENCVSDTKIEKLASGLRSVGQSHQLADILEDSNFQPVHVHQNIHENQKGILANQRQPLKELSVSANRNTQDQLFTHCEKTFYDEKIVVDVGRAKEIGDATLGQSCNSRWFEERKIRITASNFYEVCHRRKEPVDPLVCRLIGPKPFKSKYTQWGQQAESVALAQYKLQKELEGNVVVGRSSGLVVNPAYPFLGCSPDWLVELHKDGEISRGAVEVKSLAKHAKLTPLEASKTKESFLQIENGKLQLSRNHRYYSQVQGQLLVCDLEWCDFVVWSPMDMFVERIQKDRVMCSNMVDKLSTFFFKHMLPRIVEKFSINKNV